MAAINKFLPRLSKARGISRPRQGGFVRLAMNLARWGSKKFTYRDLFAQGEPGVHFEAYNPDALLQRRNFATWSEDFENSAWGKTGVTVTQNAVAAPDGAVSADKLVSSGAGQNRVDISVAFGGVVTISVYGKIGEARWLFAGSAQFANQLSWFDLQTGTKGTLGAACTSYDMVADANGFYRCSVTFTTTANTFLSIGISNADNSVTPPAAASGAYVWGGQVDKGALTAYQKVTDWNTEYLAAALAQVGMFQDDAGAAPVTAAEQTVGLWMDRKFGLQRGPQNLADPGFDDASKWSTSATWAIAGSAVTLTNCLNTDGPVGTTAVDVVAGTAYEVFITVSAVTLGGIRVSVGATTSLGVITVPGTYRYQLRAASTATPRIVANGTTSGVVTSFSVQAVRGDHASQSVAGSRPKLSARYNLLTKTEQFTNAAWSFLGAASGAVTDNAIVAPDGTQTAGRIVLNAGDNRWGQSFGAGATGVPYTGKVWLKAPAAASYELWIIEAAANVTRLVVALTTQWQQFTITRTTTTLNTPFLEIASLGTGGINDVRPAGEVHIWHPDFRFTGDAALSQPAYQRVNTATDYDTAGFIHYLKFDGIDDSLQTPAVNFSAVNKMTAWAGVTKLSDAATGIICELTSVASNPGGFYVAASLSAGANFAFSATGTTTQDAGNTANTFAAPVTDVVTSLMDTAAATQATQLNARLNGVAPALTYSLGPTSPGNFANSNLNIGRRNNASVPFNGRMTSLTVRGSATPASTRFIKEMEQYAARLAGQTFVST